VVILTKYKNPHGWANCVDGFIRVVKEINMMHIEPVGAIVARAKLVPENTASDSIDCVRLVTYYGDFDTYVTVYSVPMPQSSCAGGRELVN